MFDDEERAETVLLWQTIVLYSVLALTIGYVVCLWLRYMKEVQKSVEVYGGHAQFSTSNISSSYQKIEKNYPRSSVPNQLM